MSTRSAVDALASIGIARLANFWGEGRLEGLSELGVSTRPRAVAEAMLSESGMAVFKNKNLRNAVLEVFSPRDIRDKLGTGPDGRPVAITSNFTWGKNASTAQFLKLK